MPCSTRSQKPTIGNFTRTILEHYFVTDVLADQFRLNLTSIRLAKSTYYRHYRILYTNNFFYIYKYKTFLSNRTRENYQSKQASRCCLYSVLSSKTFSRKNGSNQALNQFGSVVVYVASLIPLSQLFNFKLKASIKEVSDAQCIDRYALMSSLIHISITLYFASHNMGNLNVVSHKQMQQLLLLSMFESKVLLTTSADCAARFYTQLEFASNSLHQQTLLGDKSFTHQANAATSSPGLSSDCTAPTTSPGSDFIDKLLSDSSSQSHTQALAQLFASEPLTIDYKLWSGFCQQGLILHALADTGILKLSQH